MDADKDIGAPFVGKLRPLGQLKRLVPGTRHAYGNMGGIEFALHAFGDIQDDLLLIGPAMSNGSGILATMPRIQDDDAVSLVPENIAGLKQWLNHRVGIGSRDGPDLAARVDGAVEPEEAPIEEETARLRSENE